ncbi:MAG: hypothetical protein ACWGNK_11200, partial [Desulfobacterales bacterium]
MKKHILGDNGPDVSAIGLSCMEISEIYGKSDKSAASPINGDIDSLAKEAFPYVLMDVIVLIIISLLPILS